MVMYVALSLYFFLYLSLSHRSYLSVSLLSLLVSFSQMQEGTHVQKTCTPASMHTLLRPGSLFMMYPIMTVLFPWMPFSGGDTVVFKLLHSFRDVWTPAHCFLWHSSSEDRDSGMCKLIQSLIVGVVLVPTLPWVPAVDHPNFQHPLLLGSGLWKQQGCLFFRVSEPFWVVINGEPPVLQWRRVSLCGDGLVGTTALHHPSSPFLSPGNAHGKRIWFIILGMVLVILYISWKASAYPNCSWHCSTSLISQRWTTFRSSLLPCCWRSLWCLTVVSILCWACKSFPPSPHWRVHCWLVCILVFHTHTF